MGDLYRMYLEIGDELFARGSQEEALTYYQKSYGEGNGCSEALIRIEERYVLPQEENSRGNYAENCSTSKLHFSYENCQIDFIPAGDKKFILFDREAGRFCGSFDMQSYMDKEIPNKTFQSVLIADHWDAREVLPVLNQHIWNNIYIALNDSIGKFMSFFKLPGFASLLPEGLHIFQHTEEMRDYFAKNPDAYLPHVIYSPDREEYEKLVEGIHQGRIQSGAHSSNVFLSICIPSYDRGKRALEAVQHDLEMKYDAEVEILVSNNGSNVGKEEYEMIRDMRDSRVRYYQFEENRGIAANVCNCLEKATGHFAILFSDEDNLILENLDEVLDHLIARLDLGGFSVDVENEHNGYKIRGRYKKLGKGFHQKGVNATVFSLYVTYITGIGINLAALRQYGILSKIDYSDADRHYLDRLYPHTTIIEYLAEYFDMENMEIIIASYGETSKTGGIELPDDGKRIPSYYILKNNLLLDASKLQIAEKILAFEDYKKFFLRCASYSLGNSASAIRDCWDRMETKCTWVDTHIILYKNCLKIMSESKWGMEAFDSAFFHDLDEVFLDWLDCRRIRPVFSERENFKATLRAQMARYYWEHGAPFLEIDFKAIDEKLDEAISQGLPAGSAGFPKGGQADARDD